MKKNNLLNIIAIIVFIAILFVLNMTLDTYKLRIFNLAGIYVILGLGLNLVNGFTGLFSLGHAGFMAIGAYTGALLTMSPEMKEMTFFLEPITPILANIQLPFPIALLAAGVVAGAIGFLIGAPVLRLKDDYLAIATLGFSEIIRIVLTNMQTITNGALGLKGIPGYANIWWIWGISLVVVVFMVLLIKSSYGKVFKGIREDEIAAEAMGVNIFKHKMMSFVIGCALAGIGGALLGSLIGAINPLLFRFLFTFNVLLIVVLGGMGSITGTVLSAVLVTVMIEYLRVLDIEMNLGFIRIPGVPGLRMVVFSLILLIVILFYQRGIMGTNELTWEKLFDFKNRIAKKITRRKSS